MNQRPVYTCLFLIFCCTALNAQVASWIWAKHAGNSHYELATAISSDKNGYMLVTGSFSSPSVVIGSTQLTNASLFNMSDFFIAKYDTAGNVIWVQSYGGLLTDDASDVTSDLSGNIFVSGTFNSDPLIIGNDTLHCTDPMGDSADIFVAAFDPLGNPLWARSSVGLAHDEASSIETDAGGNIYVTGDFDSDTIRFGSYFLTNASPGNAYDAFLVKYDGGGNILWAHSLGGTGYEFSKGVTVDANGNVIIAGYSASDSILTSVNVLVNASSPGTSDAFVARYNGSGALLWARMFGGSSTEQANDVESDVAGNIFICGQSYSAWFTIGTDSFVNHSAFGTDIFLVKYDSQGNYVWISNAGGFQDDNATAVHCDNQNNIYIGGNFASGVAYFGSDSLINNYPGYGDIFISQYDQNGSEVTVLQAAGSQSDGILGLTSDGWGGIYAVGSYNSPSCQFGTITLPFAGFYDMFVAKWSVFWTGIPSVDASIEGPVIFPNPCADVINIAVDSRDGAQAELYSQDGQLIFVCPLNNGMNVLSIALLSDGVYLLRVIENRGVSMKKVVKNGVN